MKIVNVRLDNWLAHRHLNLPLSPFTIICGPNESGKTSIAQAIRFAMLNELARVDLKSESHMLLSHGTERGSVTISCGDAEPVSCQRDIVTGKLKGKAQKLPVGDDTVTQAIPFCLDPGGFARVAPDERRTLLFAVMGIALTVPALKTMLIERGHDPDLVAMLRDDSDLATLPGVCEQQAAEARGAWKQITGETYGAVKAEGWAADVPEQTPDEEVEVLDRDITGLKQQIAELQKASGAAEAHAKAAAARAQKIAAIRKGWPADVGKFEAAIADMHTQTERARLENKEAEDAWRELALAEKMPPLLVCDACGAKNILQAGDLKRVPDDTPMPRKVTAAQVENAHVHHQRMRKNLDSLEFTLATGRKRLEQIANDKAMIAQLEVEPEEKTTGLDPKALEISLTRSQAALDAAMDTFAAIVGAKRAAELAEIKTSSARRYHALVAGWMALRDACAPSGIPGELLSQALDGFNATLARLSFEAGWPVVCLTPAMHICRQDEPYSLLSKSAQWKADLLITIALAETSGFRAIVLDEADIIEPQARKRLLMWLHQLTQDKRLDTAILLATLKEAPVVPRAIRVYWLEGRKAVDAVAA